MTGKVLLVALGAVGAFVGLALAVTGAVLLLLTGHGGTFGGSEATLTTERYALVSDAAGLGSGGIDATVRVRVEPTGGRPVFVGVGPAAAVDRYLSGVPYDELTAVRLTPLRATLVPRGGDASPARPGDQRMWTVSATGAGPQTIEVPVGDGGQRLVVMNADGSAGVEVIAALTLRERFLRTLAVGLIAGGLVVAVAGGVVLVLGIRRTARSRDE